MQFAPLLLLNGILNILNAWSLDASRSECCIQLSYDMQLAVDSATESDLHANNHS